LFSRIEPFVKHFLWIDSLSIALKAGLVRWPFYHFNLISKK
jgi:hypothetical protein